MARDVMTIRLQLRRIRVVGVLVDTISQLVVEVESTWSVSRCRWCGFKTRLVHDVRPRRFATEGSGIGRSPWCGSGAGSCAGGVTSVILRSIPSLRGSSHGVWLGSWWLMWG